MADIKIGDYLFERLAQLNIKTVFGVPGDYELALLDLIGEAGLTFSGNANELIATYAADGYARVNGAGAFVTTFGPGELSAYCGHAGSFAEFVPVVHIVGYPGVQAMKNHTLMHHSLGNGQFDVYHEMVKHISADTAILADPATAAADIDRCLNSMLYHSQPVYIGVPVDMSHRLIKGDGLQRPLRKELPEADATALENVLAELTSRIENATNPVIILDGNVVRNNVAAEANKLAKITAWPLFGTAMGKGGLDESLPNYGGVYQGAGSIPEVQKAVEEAADLVFWLGSYKTDFNTGEFTCIVDEQKTIDMQRFFVKIGARQHDVGIRSLLPALLARIEQGLQSKSLAKVSWHPHPPPAGVVELRQTSQPLTQDFLWDALSSFLRPGDLVVGETGTSAFGLTATHYPAGCSGYNQTIFGSIGYAGPSAVGAFQAAREAGALGRDILVTGEGSLQLTPMMYADLLRLDLRPLVLVLNNNGYTVERLIHGPRAAYNEIPAWDYARLCTVFGPRHESRYFGLVRTCLELEALLAGGELRDASCCVTVELVLGELDAPFAVRRVTEAIERFNQEHAQKGGSSMAG